MDDDQFGSFQASRWSEIERARGPVSSLRREALGSLVERYLPPLRAHLVLRMRINRPQAEELLHDFVQDKILERDFLAHADQVKGKFRSLLLRSLENYAIDRLRREAKHAGRDLDAQDSQCAHLATFDAPADEFDVVWARQVLNQSLERMRVECLAADRLHVWKVFDYRVLRPTLLGTPAPSYDQFSQQFGFVTPDQASNALMTAKRQFRRTLESVVAEYADSAADVEEELAGLQACVAAAGPLGVGVPHELTSDLANAFATGVSDDDSASTLENDPEMVARMLAVRGERDALWDAADLAELLKAQLAMPLAEVVPNLAKLLAADESSAEDLNALAAATLADLFAHPLLPIAVLEHVKRVARHASRDDNSSIPSDVWSAIYFASIAAALVNGGTRITKSNDETLSHGFQTIMEIPWLPLPLRLLFGEALTRTGGCGPG